MTEEGAAQVTVEETLRWLHEEGLVRLAGLSGRMADAFAAYTIDVGTGSVSAHPAVGVGLASEVITLTADDLPNPVGSPKRLVAVGITDSQAVLVVDLAVANSVSINADRPVKTVRSWALQLLLNSEVTITTNSADLAIDASPRLRHSFIPGGGAAVVKVEDGRPPISSVALNASDDRPDHLDAALDGTGEMYLGARYWRLRRVLSIEDDVWDALVDRLVATGPHLTESAESPGDS
ncbi:hypothetical protein NN3_23290 [Nocardia neocaledoniensis NBRC 108232]|uniref:Uncharacterized protein n=1 Tax=Nocardia neocaledoniensis TaxID=236511 RepID=A0A317N0U0_9NOCA|nr:hypothetical protein [Nocardia neocaledoniensis]PWV66941.1 hypothetical protein DFR69_1226 [Nocardia neocaledoniensis]GEM31322.1 hypothetical protein NN3_23290 [Nocardia neocaledoniensis NBRC 108232]